MQVLAAGMTGRLKLGGCAGVPCFDCLRSVPKKFPNA